MIRERLLAVPEWRLLMDTVPEVIDLLEQDPASRGLRELISGAWDVVGEISERWEAGAPFVWYNLGLTPDILYGLDGELGSLCIAIMSALQSLVGDPSIVHSLIDLAHSHGIPPDSCSADKVSIGAMHRGLYPKPCCVVGINTPCDAQVLSTQAMAELSERPIFVIDVPYHDEERSIRHVAEQLRELVPFLERHTGLSFDWDRLRRACERSNEAIEHIWEWLDHRRAAPLTQSSKLVAFTFVHQNTFTGSQRGVDIAAALAREARERRERGERFFEERVRAVWYQDPVWTDLQIYDWMERELGLTVPVDVFGYYAQEGTIDTSTPESMLHGIAFKLVKTQPMARQFRGNIETYIADFMQMHSAFGADCGIFAGHVACKHAWGGIGLFREACRKAGVPLLVFEFDMFDARVTPRESIEAELTRFVNEVVWPRKRARGAPR